MTDNEIVKALEEHYAQLDNGYSDYLAYGGKGDEYAEKELYMLRETLSLINRQKAEIAALTSAVDNSTKEFLKLHDTYQDQKAEIERFADIGKMYSEIKAEAIKEFAERLCEGRVSNDPVVIAVRCELKETVGEDK